MIKITYYPHCFSIFFVTIVKFTALGQEQPVIIERMSVVRSLSNLQFSTKVQKFGTPFLFQSLVRQIFSASRRKYKFLNEALIFFKNIFLCSGFLGLLAF